MATWYSFDKRGRKVVVEKEKQNALVVAILGNPEMLSEIVRKLPGDQINRVYKSMMSVCKEIEQSCHSGIVRQAKQQTWKEKTKRLNHCMICSKAVHYGRARNRFLTNHCHEGCRCNKRVWNGKLYHVLCAECEAKKHCRSSSLYHTCIICDDDETDEVCDEHPIVYHMQPHNPATTPAL